MMKIQITLFFIALSISSLVFGQAENVTTSIVDTSIDPAGYITEKKLPPPPLKGNVYLDEEWKYGNITVISGERLKGLQLRYDIQHNNLEFIYKGDDAKVCPLYLLDHYEIVDKEEATNFKNVANTNLTHFDLKGVAQVLYSGDIMLYAYTSLNIQDPTYKVEFNMGRQSSRVIKKNSFYIDDGSKAYKISGSLKKNNVVFGDYYTQIESFASKYKLNVKNEADLIQIVKFFDGLTN